jgi:hypothetical protein
MINLALKNNLFSNLTRNLLIIVWIIAFVQLRNKSAFINCDSFNMTKHGYHTGSNDDKNDDKNINSSFGHMHDLKDSFPIWTM